MMYDLNAAFHRFIPGEAFAAPPFSTVRGRPSIRLVEDKNPDSCLTVLDVPASLVVLKADKFMPLLLKKTDRDGITHHGTAFFIPETGASKRADYILIDSQSKNIVFLEMKGATEFEENIQCQLVGATAVLDYIRHVGANFLALDFKDFLGADYRRFYAGACHTGYSFRKRPTKPKAEGGGESARNFRRFSHCREIQFRTLCGGKIPSGLS